MDMAIVMSTTDFWSSGSMRSSAFLGGSEQQDSLKSILTHSKWDPNRFCLCDFVLQINKPAPCWTLEAIQAELTSTCEHVYVYALSKATYTGRRVG